MYLPATIQNCIQKLERAGYGAYAVGGCVRDACLGLIPQDYDLCTAALPEETEAVFAGEKLVLAGKKHGTVGVVTDTGVVEITTYRTEGDYQDNRHPEWVKFVSTIEEDLSRRDFTVNAMAYSPTRGFADPFGGQEDLKAGILRAVGDPELRFREDSLRILRGVRFAARFRLKPEENTLRAMEDLAPLMKNLARERVFEEISKLLMVATAEDLLRFAPILAEVIPELKPMIGFDQHSPYHAFDLFAHTAHVVENTPADLTLRWAALLHDTGKIPTFTRDETGRGHFYGHAGESAILADGILRRLKAPTALRETAVEIIGLHMNKIEASKKAVRRYLNKMGPEKFEMLLCQQTADMCSKGIIHPPVLEHFEELRQIRDQLLAEDACFCLKDLALNGHDLMALGYEGRAIGETLNRLLELVLDEQVENSKDALLAALKEQ